MLEQRLNAIRDEALNAFEKAETTQSLYDQKVKYLGKTGAFSQVMKELQGIPKEERPKWGGLINEVKTLLEAQYATRETVLKTQEMSSKLENERIDLTLPGVVRARGSQHPIRLVTNEIIQIFIRMGFSLRTGPQIEEDKYNFEALNIPADHPARDMQDTFYIDEKHVLRTQTSPIQIHALENEKPPLRILGPGAVYRCDSDISHAPMFHQMEGMYVDTNVSLSELKGTLAFFNREFFGSSVKTRFRPSYFPFTEPSAEVDCSCLLCGGKGCRMCSDSGWVEMGGCGIVHPNVFRQSGVDPKQWKGYAFGFGIERLAIMKYGIQDIRLLTRNDVRFLRQF